MTERSKLARELAALINRHSLEGGSNTPDFVLAEFLLGVLGNFNTAVTARFLERDRLSSEAPGGTSSNHSQVRERLAAYAHRSWSGWMRYLFEQCSPSHEHGVGIPANLVERWQRQLRTPYFQLPTEEQESDRGEADKMLAILRGQDEHLDDADDEFYAGYEDDAREQQKMGHRAQPSTQPDSHWFQTYTGKRIYVTQPKPEAIVLGDIAHALALTARFGGHTTKPYSVAQHSVLVADIVKDTHPQLALAALLHDATEAYLGDLIRPLKLVLPAYSKLEDEWAKVIGEAFGVRLHPLHRAIKEADVIALATERRDLFPHHIDWPYLDSCGVEPRSGTVVPWQPETAEQHFIDCVNQLIPLELKGEHIRRSREIGETP